MEFKLVVVRPFGGRVVGEVIREAEEMMAILVGEHADHVVRTGLDDVKEG